MDSMGFSLLELPETGLVQMGLLAVWVESQLRSPSATVTLFKVTRFQNLARDPGERNCNA